MSEIPFYQTRMGRTYYESTLPNLVREIHQLSENLANAVEMLEEFAAAAESDRDEKHDRPGQD